MVIRVLFLLLLAALPVRADSLRLVVPDMRPVVGEMIPVTIRGEYTGPITLEKMTFPDSPAYDWMQTARDRWRMRGWTASCIASSSGGSPSFHASPAR